MRQPRPLARPHPGDRNANDWELMRRMLADPVTPAGYKRAAIANLALNHRNIPPDLRGTLADAMQTPERGHRLGGDSPSRRTSPARSAMRTMSLTENAATNTPSPVSPEAISSSACGPRASQARPGTSQHWPSSQPTATHASVPNPQASLPS